MAKKSFKGGLAFNSRQQNKQLYWKRIWQWRKRKTTIKNQWLIRRITSLANRKTYSWYFWTKFERK